MSLIDLFTKAAELLSDHARWRSEREERRFGKFEQERQQAYEDLWKLTESIHIELRVNDLSESELLEKLRQLNAFALEHGIYLDEDDCQLANAYVLGLKNPAVAIRAAGDDDVSLAWELTQNNIPIESLAKAENLDNAFKKVRALRERLIGRVQQVVGNVATTAS